MVVWCTFRKSLLGNIYITWSIITHKSSFCNSLSLRRMEEGVVGADFREKLRAIYGERRFNCDVTCKAGNGASFATSFSRHNIETGVGSHVSYLTDLTLFHCRYLLRRYRVEQN